MRRGGTLVMAHVTGGNNNAIAEIMDRHHPIDVDAASTTFRGEGFTRFDDTREHDASARLPVVPVGTGTGRRVRVYDRT